MNERLVARVACSGCEDEVRVPLADMRIERGALYYDCPICGWNVRYLNRDEWEAMSAFDYPGGTMLSEREVDAFRRRLRYLKRHLEDEGLRP